MAARVPSAFKRLAIIESACESARRTEIFPTGCSYGEAPKNKCGCQTACPPVDCPSATKTMTNFASNDCNAAIRACIDDDDDPMDLDFPDWDESA